MPGRVLVAAIVPVLLLVPLPQDGPAAQEADAPSCAPGGPPVELDGEVGPEDARTYQVHPFEVVAGTTRIEASYSWSDLIADSPVPGNPITGFTQTVFDAGLWDQRGYLDVEGFRGWSGSRAGRVADGQEPIVVQQDIASRGYRPAPIEPGVWWFELGVAAVAPDGASWQATITCSDPEVGAPFVAMPTDPDLVLSAQAGWYHADLHAHGFHSAGNAPPWDDIVAQARDAGLEVLPVTDYVTDQHWDELGPVQERNPDILLWPGQEIITYFGHAVALGDTRNVVEYRHGFQDVTMAGIQDATLADGALFSVAHPTIFPGPVFASVCRGCEYELDDHTDWSRVDTMEVLTGPALATANDIGVAFDPGARIANPFIRTAIELWDDLLQAGHRITAVSGSDSKASEPEEARQRVGIGSSATAIWAEELSQAALAEALRSGRAYVRTLGALRSPALEVVATAPDGTTTGIGDDLAADAADLTVTVAGGQGDLLVVLVNGERQGAAIEVDADPFTVTVPIERDVDGEGPLGTVVRLETIRAVEVVDGVAMPNQILALPLDAPAEGDVLRFPTTIANPIFLTGAADGEPVPAPDPVDADDPQLPATGAPVVVAWGVFAVLAAAVLASVRPRRREQADEPSIAVAG
jgi:hypothetical protein